MAVDTSERADPRLVRLARVAESFPAFLECVVINDPPPGGGSIRWVPWPHLVDMPRLADG